MNCQLSVRAKTIRLGKYLVIQEVSARVLTSNQASILRIYDAQEGKAGSLECIHPKSPAEIFINRNKTFFDKFSLEFIQEYEFTNFCVH